MANQPNLAMGGPLPGTKYPQVGNKQPSQQFIGHGTGAISGQFTYGVSTFTETWQFPFVTDIYKVVADIIGYSSTFSPLLANGAPNPQSGFAMHRVLPKQCVLFPYLYASRITNIEGIGPRGQIAVVGAGGGTVASWRDIRLTIQFESPAYSIYDDNVVAGAGSPSGQNGQTPAESMRFVIWGREPANEFVQMQQDCFFWPINYMDANAVPNQGRTTGPIQGSHGYAQLLAKFRITGQWIGVCDDWVRNASLGFPYLDAAIGTVNQYWFMGYPPGTMLFEGYQAEPRTMPIDAFTVNINNKMPVPRAWDIKLQWLYFNPCPVGQIIATQKGDGQARWGHNLAYHVGTGLWWRPILGGLNNPDANGYWRYRETDHSLIFGQPAVGTNFFCNGISPNPPPAIPPKTQDSLFR